MIFMHPSTNDMTTSEDRIPRLSKSGMHEPLHDEEGESYYKVYDCPKKTQMPSVLISNSTDTDYDHAFLKDVTLSGNCPEFNGYNTHLC